MLCTGDLKITPPFFEIGPKAYLYGADVLELARHADIVGKKYAVQMIITPQYVDIPLLAREMKNVLDICPAHGFAGSWAEASVLFCLRRLKRQAPSG